MSVYHFYEQLLTLIFALSLTLSCIFLFMIVLFKLTSGDRTLKHIPNGVSLILSLIKTAIIIIASSFFSILIVQSLKDVTVNNSNLTAQSLNSAEKFFDKNVGFEDLAGTGFDLSILAISTIIGIFIMLSVISIFRIIVDTILYFKYYDKDIYPLLRSRSIKDINEGLDKAIVKAQEKGKKSIKLDRYTSNHIALAVLSMNEDERDMKLEVIDRHNHLFRLLNARKVSQKGVD